MMKKSTKKKIGGVAGGIGILAAAAVLCIKGMKVVDGRLKAKKEAASEVQPDVQVEDIFEE